MSFGIVEILLTVFVILFFYLLVTNIQEIKNFKNKIILTLEIWNNIFGNTSQENKIIYQTSKKFVLISFPYLGVRKNIFLPFKFKPGSSQITASLIMEDGTEKDITHPLGIPYFLSAKDLGGKEIIIVNHEEGQNFKFENDEIPQIE